MPEIEKNGNSNKKFEQEHHLGLNDIGDPQLGRYIEREGSCIGRHKEPGNQPLDPRHEEPVLIGSWVRLLKELIHSRCVSYKKTIEGKPVCTDAYQNNRSNPSEESH